MGVLMPELSQYEEAYADYVGSTALQAFQESEYTSSYEALFGVSTFCVPRLEQNRGDPHPLDSKRIILLTSPPWMRKALGCKKARELVSQRRVRTCGDALFQPDQKSNGLRSGIE